MKIFKKLFGGRKLQSIAGTPAPTGKFLKKHELIRKAANWDEIHAKLGLTKKKWMPSTSELEIGPSGGAVVPHGGNIRRMKIHRRPSKRVQKRIACISKMVTGQN